MKQFSKALCFHKRREENDNMLNLGNKSLNLKLEP